MSNNILDFGKNKNKQISECDTKYLQWLVSHVKVLALRNRWSSRDAGFELQRRAQAAAEAAMAVRAAEEIVEAPKQTYRIVSAPGPKRGRFDLLSEIEAKRENRFAMLGEINEIKARSKRSADLGLKGLLSSNKAFSILR
jgi:hypothetical protein